MMISIIYLWNSHQGLPDISNASMESNSKKYLLQGSVIKNIFYQNHISNFEIQIIKLFTYPVTPPGSFIQCMDPFATFPKQLNNRALHLDSPSRPIKSEITSKLPSSTSSSTFCIWLSLTSLLDILLGSSEFSVIFLKKIFCFNLFSNQSPKN